MAIMGQSDLKFLITKSLKVFGSLLFSIVFWTVLLTFSGILFPLRYAVQTLLNVIYGRGKYTLANGIDALFAYDKAPGSSAIVASLLILKGYPDLDAIRRRFSNLFNSKMTLRTSDEAHSVRKLQSIFQGSKFGFPCWKDASENFDINRHIRIMDGLIQPKFQDLHFDEEINNPLITPEKLQLLVASLWDQKTLFENKRPQWELLIVPNYQYENSREPHFVIVFRDHHAIGDGCSIGFFMDLILADAPLKMTVDPTKPFKGSNKWMDALNHSYAAAFGPLPFFKTLISAILDDSCWNLKEGYSSKKIVTFTKQIDLEFLKELRVKSETSIAAILLTAITGAARKFQEVHKDRPRFSGAIAESINVANITVMLPYPDRQLQNHFSTFSIPCPLAENRSEIRLKKTDRIARNISASTEPLFNFFIMRYAGYLPRLIQDPLAYVAGTPVMFSNVPGPTEKFTICGQEVQEIVPWLPLIKNYSLGIATYSCNGKLRLNFTTDSSLFKNKLEVDWFIDQIQMELSSLGKFYEVTTKSNANSITKDMSKRRTSYSTA